MRFTLTYDGPLPASGNDAPRPHKPDSKLAIKWAIRDHLRGQLADLFASHPAVSSGQHSPTYAEFQIRQPIQRGPYAFIALVRPHMDLICGLTIKMLVNHEPGSVITRSGDLDNRLKTLLDALRVPADEQECRGRAQWDGTYPCLLEDDAVVTDIQLNCERWFGAAGKSENEVHLEIEIRVRTSKPSPFSGFFGID